jgi:hypothetical protein
MGADLILGEKAAALQAATFDRAALGGRRLGYEWLDQLTVELLLGVCKRSAGWLPAHPGRIANPTYEHHRGAPTAKAGY